MTELLKIKHFLLTIQQFYQQIYNTAKLSKYYSNHFHKKDDICDFKLTTTISKWKNTTKH